MRKQIIAFAVVFLAWGLPALVQGELSLQIRLSVSSKSVLVGEPAILHLEVENTSGKELVLPARPAWHMLRFGGLLFAERPTTETPYGYEGGPTAGNPVPVYASKVRMAAGEILVLPPLEIRNGNPGRCRAVYRFDSREVHPEINLKTRAPEPNEDVWRGFVESVEVGWEVCEPQGEDLLAMQAYQRSIPNALRGWILEKWEPELLSRFPTSTYAGYVLAKKVRDLSDWRLKVAPTEKFVEDARKRPHLFRECKEEVEFFSLLEQHIEGGHVPGGLASQLYGFYGEQLLLRGRETEALAAFRKATCEEPQDAKGRAYYLRSLAFLKALGEERPPTGRSAP